MKKRKPHNYHILYIYKIPFYRRRKYIRAKKMGRNPVVIMFQTKQNAYQIQGNIRGPNEINKTNSPGQGDANFF